MPGARRCRVDAGDDRYSEPDREQIGAGAVPQSSPGHPGRAQWHRRTKTLRIPAGQWQGEPSMCRASWEELVQRGVTGGGLGRLSELPLVEGDGEQEG
jgi:hypothetical protein